MSLGPSSPGEREALLVVDVQNDFCPGGSLAVAGGNSVIAPINRLIEQFLGDGKPILFSRDWHPAETSHFQTRGGPWPEHCIQRSHGAEWHPALDIPPGAIIISKGVNADEDGYSAFVGQDDTGRPLKGVLRDLGVTSLLVCGLATDYCVKDSVLEGRAAGFDVAVLSDGIAAVNVKPGDGERALEQMREAGATLRASP